MGKMDTRVFVVKIPPIVFLLIVLGLTSCQTGANRVPGVAVAQSIKSRLTTANATADEAARLVSDNRAFAVDLYRQLKTARANLFFSPYSISSALGMTYAGARDATAEQMAKAMRFTLPAERLHAAFNALDLELARRGQGAKGKDDKGFRLRIVNALWGQKDYTFLPAFLDVLAENYGAGIRLLDFANAPDDSRAAINRWVSDQTEGRIKDLLAKGEIDGMTRLVLTNAIYLNAAWDSPFDKNVTQEGTFNLSDGTRVTVPMMRQTTNLAYLQAEGFQAIELPYDQRELAMLILLPAPGQFDAFENSLGAEGVDTTVKRLANKRIALTMPRFQFDGKFKLADTLQSLGMRDAFAPGAANFAGMDGTRNLFIKNVVHQAFVAVDEAGTEAAAATGVEMGLTALGDQPIVVSIDRPFLFLIRDLASGAILFIGRVHNPAS